MVYLIALRQAVHSTETLRPAIPLSKSGKKAILFVSYDLYAVPAWHDECFSSRHGTQYCSLGLAQYVSIVGRRAPFVELNQPISEERFCRRRGANAARSPVELEPAGPLADLSSTESIPARSSTHIGNSRVRHHFVQTRQIVTCELIDGGQCRRKLGRDLVDIVDLTFGGSG